MKTQTNYFDKLDYTFINKKQYVSNTTKSIEINTKSKDFRPFYLTPNRIENQSVVGKLKSLIGEEFEGIKTLKTDYISFNRVTIYNGNYITLRSDDKKVFMYVSMSDGLFLRCDWNIKDIVSTLKSKNIGKRVTTSMVNNLINEGKLQVKFNVSKIKDHGTIWKIIS